VRLAALVCVLLACRSESRTSGPRGDAAPVAARARDAAPVARDPLVPAITDPALLAALEQHGLGLGAMLGAESAVTNAELDAASALYRDFAALTREDIAASVAEENRYRPDWGEVGTTLHAKRRNLDPGWLTAGNAGYELVGVVNRMDRAVFAPGTCGELRLLYRLAYRGAKIASRLPLTINLVYVLEPGARSCRDKVAEWRITPDVDWLRTRGPLRPENLAHFKSLETNYQVIRSAAGIRNQMGGSAEYVLRVFHRQAEHLVRAPLENTPDAARLAADPALRGELVAFLRDETNLAAIDRGTILLPDRFLATQASSFAPHGLARLQNRPFGAVLEAGDFDGLDLSARRVVRTPEALIRRLDDLSCVGCHQGRTIAGFHFVGEDRPDTHPLNAIFFAGSGHFRSDLVRRVAYLEELERGGEPSPERPFSFAPTTARAGYGDLCSLPGARSFPDWTCDHGLRCQVIDPAVGESELGQCFPDERRAGDPCLRNQVIQAHHSLDKMIMPWTELGCAEGYACRMPGAGFPNGMCTGPCEVIGAPGEICGPTAGAGFADCLAGKASFATCLERHREKKSRGRCNAGRSCRNDYICARIGDGQDGACVPAYFLFQLRVDGHPAPG
jgi:hypothetical protein